jgi:hypothetical protein
MTTATAQANLAIIFPTAMPNPEKISMMTAFVSDRLR